MVAGVVVAAGCGGPKPAARVSRAPVAVDAGVAAAPVDAAPEQPLGIDWAHAKYATDEDALALWAKMGLRGDNFEDRVGMIPESPPALREAMAKALLRQGNFACPTSPPPACVDADLDAQLAEDEMHEVAADATLDDPCMRRVIALWALDELDDDVLGTELAPDLIALAALPPPEHELNRAALYRIHDPTMALQAIAAAKAAHNDEVADDNLGGMDVTTLAHAAIDLHVDGAVLQIGADEATLPVFEAAVVDPLLRRDTRVAAVRELSMFLQDVFDPGSPVYKRGVAAIERARDGADCVTAGVAAGELTTLGAKPPKSAKLRSEADVLRWLCVELAGAPGERDVAPGVADRWQKAFAPGGVVLEQTFEDPYRKHELSDENPDVPDADGDGWPDLPPEELDPDGNGDPSTWTEVVRMRAAELPGSDAWSELVRAIESCDATSAGAAGAECAVPAAHVRFRFVWGKGRGGQPVIKTIVRTETYADC